MAYAKPFFRGGKLVQRQVITKLVALDMAAAESWLSVQSSNVKKICFRLPSPDDGGKNGLGICFYGKSKPDAYYFYKEAPYDAYIALKNAASKGKHVREVIIPSFAHAGPFASG